MKTVLLFCLSAIVCACTPHEVRCEGHLEPINVPGTIPTTAAHVDLGARRVVP